MLSNSSAHQSQTHELLARMMAPAHLRESLKLEPAREAYEKLLQSCRENLVPANVLPIIRDAYDQVIRNCPLRSDGCLRVINMLAQWQPENPEHKWSGLRQLVEGASAQSPANQAILLNSFYSSCAELNRPEAVAEAFSYAGLCRNYSVDQFTSVLLLHAGRLVSPPGAEGARLAQSLPFQLAERYIRGAKPNILTSSLNRFYRSEHALSDCLVSGPRVTVTLEGHLAREDLLKNQHFLPDGNALPFSQIRARLKTISDCEDAIALLKTSAEERRAFMISPHRETYLSSIKKLPLAEQRETLLGLILEAESGHSQLPHLLAKTLAKENKNRTSSLQSFIEQVEDFKLSGVELPLSILLSGDLREEHEMAFAIVQNSYEPDELYYDMLKGLQSFARRVEREWPGNEIDALRSGMYEITRPDRTELSRADLQRSETILGHRPALDKLILCLQGKGLPENEAINSTQALGHFLTELESRTEISEYLHSSAAGDGEAMWRFAKRFHIDNPPFSRRLETNPNTVAMQAKFQSQVQAIFLRREDAHYGFWANTFTMKHTPLGHRCAFDEFAVGVNSLLHVVPAHSPNVFPGRGRIIQDIDINTIFSEVHDDRTWREDVFAKYGPLPGVSTPGNVHALDNLTRAHIGMFRAFDAVSVPSNRFFHIDGVSMTLVCSNHHFDATGAHEVTIVPTLALNSFFDPIKVPYDPYQDSFPDARHGDISVNPPTLRAIDQRAKEMGLPIGVIQVTSGSCFNGGFCNGLEPGNSNYHSWEQGQASLDSFGHAHKFYIKGQPATLHKLHGLHDRIYEVTTGLLNVRDVFKFALGFDARGTLTHYRQHENEADRTLADSGIQYGGRTLKLFCEFADEFRQQDQRSKAPVLVIAPMKFWAAEPDTHLVLDGTTGYAFHAWGAPFDMEISEGMPSQRTIDWWKENVDPFLAEHDNKWHAPRIVSRGNYTEVIREYGSK